MAEEEWQVMKSKKKTKKTKNRCQQSMTFRKKEKGKSLSSSSYLLSLNDEVNIINPQVFFEHFLQIRQYFIQTTFYLSCKEIITNISSKFISNTQNVIAQSIPFDNFDNPLPPLGSEYQKIVLLGVGNFTQSSSSCLQLALCLELFPLHPNIFIYDPLLSSNEIELCHLLGLKIDNTMSIHEAHGTTFYYMPHCPFTLYNKILWSNWGNNLRNICILGNSFQSYLLRRIEDLDSPCPTIRSDCMKLLEDITEEFAVWRNEYRHDEVLKRYSSFSELHSLENAFNDTSVMYFIKSINRDDILNIDRRPCQEDMLADLEDDLELIRQEIC